MADPEVCVYVCENVRACVFFFNPAPPEAVLAVSPAQSVRLCEVKPVVGGIWAGAPAPLKSFAPTRQRNKSQSSEELLSMCRGMSV